MKLDPEIETRLTELAATGRSKSCYVGQAIEEFLDNRADYLVAISILEKNQPTIGIDELRRELSIEEEFLEFLDQGIRKNPHHVKNVPPIPDCARPGTYARC